MSAKGSSQRAMSVVQADDYAKAAGRQKEEADNGALPFTAASSSTIRRSPTERRSSTPTRAIRWSRDLVAVPFSTMPRDSTVVASRCAKDRCRRRVGQVVGRHVDRPYRGHRSLMGGGDTLLQHANVGGERRLVVHRRRDGRPRAAPRTSEPAWVKRKMLYYWRDGCPRSLDSGLGEMR
jgi:hypothetical protein